MAAEEIENRVADGDADLGGSGVSARRNTPSGRFWIGKSAPARFADSTQLRRCGSCVSLMGMAGLHDSQEW